MRSLLTVGVISIAIGGCGGMTDDGSTVDGPVGSAVARITTVPPSVGCVSISVVGANRSVVRNFDVTPGQSATLHLGNLPVGTDAFTSAAYGVACSGIAGAQASWASTAPFFAPVSQGNVTSLVLTLEPTGGANIGINFDTDGGGSCDGDGGCTGGDGGTGFDGGVNDLSPNFGDGGPSGPDLAGPPFDGGGLQG
jgi:hypothetical protein